MIVIRMVKGVSDHFPARRSEWVLAAMLLGWGIILGPPSTSVFATSPAFAGLDGMAPEWVWAWVCLLIGVVRLLALLINGTFAHTFYGHWSPHVRGALAFLSCFIWTAISIGVFNSGALTTGIIIYPGLLALEITNLKEAWQDAGEADRGDVDGIV